MCKLKSLFYGSKCDQHKNECQDKYQDKYILADDTLKRISTQLYYTQHNIIKPVEAIINIHSILLIYVENYKTI